MLQFAALGLGLGAVYSMLSLGLVSIYRASGIVNFAQSGFAIAGAYSFYELYVLQHCPLVVAILAATGAGMALGLVSYWLFLRRMRRASALTRVVATLGLLIIIQGLAGIRYKDSVLTMTSFLLKGSVHIGGARIGDDRLVLLGIAAALSGALYAASRLTLIGLATTAVAENERAAAARGWSPDFVAACNWALSGALAGLAGCLVIPLTGLTVGTVTFLIIPALAGALVGVFNSYPLAFVGCMAIGILESETSRYVNLQGAPQAVPLLAVFVLMVVRGQALPLRSHLVQRLPGIGTGRLRPGWVLGVSVPLALLMLNVCSANWNAALTVSFIGAMMMLSLVVLTGYAGQLSLAQFALAGVGALVAAQLVARAKVPFELSIVAGMLGSLAVGLVFALPSLRARGINLAIVTLGMGYALEQVVFNSPTYTGGALGLNVGPQRFLGLKLDPISDPAVYGVFVLGALLVVSVAVCNIRRSVGGRRMLAVRGNERAAASLGISVHGAKIYAFAVSAAIAGLAGVLYGFTSPAIVFTSFDTSQSINYVAQAVVGGIGYVLGPLFGATLVQGGFPGGIISFTFRTFNQWLAVLGGVILIVMVVRSPDGIAEENVHLIAKLVDRVRRSAPHPPETIETPTSHPERVRSRRLCVRSVTVQFGGVIALESVDLEIQPGEILGLIGPNGAGKSTLIDAISGFVPLAKGQILLDGVSIDRLPAYKRAREGVTRSFQSLELFDDMSVLDNLRVAADPRDWLAYATSIFRPSHRPLPASGGAAIDVFGLTGVLNRRPGELPYGQRRLLAIARSVTSSPSILLLDEPAAGLDETETAELSGIIRRLATDWGMSILLIEHDMSVIMGVCDRVAVLEFGKKIADGSPDEVQTSPAVIAAYLGSDSVVAVTD